MAFVSTNADPGAIDGNFNYNSLRISLVPFGALTQSFYQSCRYTTSPSTLNKCAEVLYSAGFDRLGLRGELELPPPTHRGIDCLQRALQFFFGSPCNNLLWSQGTSALRFLPLSYCVPLSSDPCPPLCPYSSDPSTISSLLTAAKSPSASFNPSENSASMPLLYIHKMTARIYPLAGPTLRSRSLALNPTPISTSSLS